MAGAHGNDGWHRAIVQAQRDLCEGVVRQKARQLCECSVGGSAESIDGLRIVPDDRELPPPCLQLRYAPFFPFFPLELCCPKIRVGNSVTSASVTSIF